MSNVIPFDPLIDIMPGGAIYRFRVPDDKVGDDQGDE